MAGDGKRRRSGEALAPDLQEAIRRCPMPLKSELADILRVEVRTLQNWMGGGHVRDTNRNEILEKINEFFRRIREGSSVDHRSPVKTSPGLSGAQSRFDEAMAALNTERAQWALGVIQWTYWELLRTELAEALLRLPRVMYAAFRYGSYRDVTQLAVETIQAIKQAPKHLTMPEKTRTAALAVLACCLNEGQHYAEARDLFNSVRGTLAKPDDPEFGWTTGTVNRSQTHLNVWHHGSPREIERYLREAAVADEIRGTTTPIIHTKCDVSLQHQPERAWQTIEPEFRRVMGHIVENYDLETGLLKAGKTPLARLHHEVGSIILGLFAAGQLDGALGHDEIDYALRIIRLLGYGRMSFRRQPKWNGALHEDMKKNLARIYAETVTEKLETPIVWAPRLVELALLLPH